LRRLWVQVDAVERSVGKLDDHKPCLAQRDDALDVVRRADVWDLGGEGHRRGRATTGRDLLRGEVPEHRTDGVGHPHLARFGDVHAHQETVGAGGELGDALPRLQVIGPNVTVDPARHQQPSRTEADPARRLTGLPLEEHPHRRIVGAATVDAAVVEGADEEGVALGVPDDRDRVAVLGLLQGVEGYRAGGGRGRRRRRWIDRGWRRCAAGRDRGQYGRRGDDEDAVRAKRPGHDASS
jgi:hypothetical protein